MAKGTARWSEIKKNLTSRERAELIGVIQALHDASPDNRLFLTAHLKLRSGEDSPLEAYRKRIIEQFFPDRGEAKLRLADARKAIRDYRAATDDTTGVLDLMLTFIEQGTEFTNQFGDIDEPFYDNLGTVLDQAASVLELSECKHLYPVFADRLWDLKYEAADLGWGYGDQVKEVVDRLEQQCGDE